MSTAFLQLLYRKYWVRGHALDVEIFAISLYNIPALFTRKIISRKFTWTYSNLTITLPNPCPVIRPTPAKLANSAKTTNTSRSSCAR